MPSKKSKKPGRDRDRTSLISSLRSRIAHLEFVKKQLEEINKQLKKENKQLQRDNTQLKLRNETKRYPSKLPIH